jgi:DNA-binding MurR/RpiR family transcriptional regulator
LSTNILVEIRQQLPSFSDRKRNVGTWILEHHEDAAFLSTSQLAKACGVSESTITRFSTELGYERFADMQKDLRVIVKGKLSQMERLELSKDRKDTNSSISKITKMMRTDMESIEKTILNIPEDELDKIVDAISSARNVYVIGSRSAYGLAHYFGFALSWIKPHVWMTDGPGNMQFDRMMEASEGDVAFAISTFPYPRNTVEMLCFAEENGLTTIAVTDSHTSPLARRAKHCLIVHNEDITFADNVAPVSSLLTALLALISQKNPKRSAQTLKKLEDFWVKSNIYDRD